MYRQSHAGEETGEQILIFSQTAKLHFHFRIFVIKIKATVAVQHLNFTLDDLTLPSIVISLTKEISKRKLAPAIALPPLTPQTSKDLLCL